MHYRIKFLNFIKPRLQWRGILFFIDTYGTTFIKLTLYDSSTFQYISVYYNLNPFKLIIKREFDKYRIYACHAFVANGCWRYGCWLLVVGCW